jgi:hypothetical protein
MRKIILTILSFFVPFITFAEPYIRNYYVSNGRHVNFIPLFLVIFFPLLFIVLSILGFIFWIFMLIDAIKHSSNDTKVVWVLVIIFTQVIGAIIYYFAEKRPRNKANN